MPSAPLHLRVLQLFGLQGFCLDASAPEFIHRAALAAQPPPRVVYLGDFWSISSLCPQHCSPGAEKPHISSVTACDSLTLCTYLDAGHRKKSFWQMNRCNTFHQLTCLKSRGALCFVLLDVLIQAAMYLYVNFVPAEIYKGLFSSISHSPPLMVLSQIPVQAHLHLV